MEQQAGKGLEQEQERPEESGSHMSRRKLLTSFGMAGVALAAGSILGGSSTVYGKEGSSVTGSVYEEANEKGQIPPGIEKKLDHNELAGRDMTEAHPASAILDSSGKTQQEINDSSVYTIESISEMLALDSTFQTRTIRMKTTGAMYMYDAAKSSVNDGFYTLNGWVLVGYYDRLLATLAGLKGDGTNEYTKLQALFDVAATLKLPIHLCGLTISTSSLTAIGDIKLIGSGGITLFAGSNGTLLNTAYNLIIDGDIEIDQNKANNTGGTITSESHCSIKHSGDSLILRGVKFKPSVSINIVTRAKKKLICENIEVDGGMIGLYAITPLAKVSITGGEYKNAALYDNIQILNGEDVYISGVTSHDAQRSGIVISNTTKKARIIGNLSYGNKKDSANQGGWGIVCSVNTLNSVVSSNICIGNQVGGITLDTFPALGVESLDSKISVVGNIIHGLFNNTYSTTGISLNDAQHVVLSANNIYKVAQGIHTDRANYANIIGNTIQDVNAYFIQLNRSNHATIKGNRLDGCSNPPAGVLSCINSYAADISGNTLTNLPVTGSTFRFSGTSSDWVCKGNSVIRDVVGSGYVFHILGAANTGGIIKGNTIKSKVSGGWQWYIVSDNNAQFSSFDNIVEAAGTSYIYQGANATAGDDTVNGSRNVWATAPAFKSRIGQVAVISSALKYWNGTAWT